MLHRSYLLITALIAMAMLSTQASAFSRDQQGDRREAAAAATADLPIREVTIFKDGHALVMRSGIAPTDERGDVVIDALPIPVLGTFWARATDERATMRGLVVGERMIQSQRNAASLQDLLEANIGAMVTLTDVRGAEHHGRVLAVPQPAAPTPPGNVRAAAPAAAHLGQRIIILQRDDEVHAFGLHLIERVSFHGEHDLTAIHEEKRPMLTLRMDWEDGAPAESAATEMMYLQKGLRWIPNYMVTIDDSGNARIRLQATIINELDDLQNAMAHLVIGVPTFAFHHTLDPMAIHGRLIELSHYFEAGRTGNVIMSQTMSNVARMGEHSNRGEPAEPPADGLAEGDGVGGDDLYIFSVSNITLRRGERMIVPVVEFTVPYEDVFILDLPPLIASDVRAHLPQQVQRDMAEFQAAPKVMRTLRLTNTSRYPFTTAPAMIVRDDRVSAQGLMTYAAPGASVDLPVTAAMDITAHVHDEETKRTPNAVQWSNQHFHRVDMSGIITLRNLRARAVHLEVRRTVIGPIDEVGAEGKGEMLNVIQQSAYATPGWPAWLTTLNGIGRMKWSLELAPGQHTELPHTWHYFTR